MKQDIKYFRNFPIILKNNKEKRNSGNNGDTCAILIKKPKVSNQVKQLVFNNRNISDKMSQEPEILTIIMDDNQISNKPENYYNNGTKLTKLITKQSSCIMSKILESINNIFSII
ncbi:hypothetical protein ABPG74_021827 [Tetrahymena malaccensis]